MLVPITNNLIRFKPKQLQGKICLSPWRTIEITLNGDIRLCGCQAWMPSTVGNIFQQSLDSIINNANSQVIRQSIINGTYDYCNENVCGIMSNKTLLDMHDLDDDIKEMISSNTVLNKLTHIYIAGDNACNLSCPSCRTSKITSTLSKKQDKILGQTLKQNLLSNGATTPINLIISTSGEIFASVRLMSFINQINPKDYPNLSLHLQTNSLLAPKNFHKLGAIAANIKSVTVSIDAARPDTYEILRRGANWNSLLKSMKFLQTLKHDIGFKFVTRMIVQEENFKEIPEFYNFCDSFDVDSIEYLRLLNWSTFGNPEDFRKRDVLDSMHHLRSHVKHELAQVQTLPKTYLGGGIL